MALPKYPNTHKLIKIEVTSVTGSEATIAFYESTLNIFGIVGKIL